MVCPGPLQVPSRSFSGTFWARLDRIWLPSRSSPLGFPMHMRFGNSSHQKSAPIRTRTRNLLDEGAMTGVNTTAPNLRGLRSRPQWPGRRHVPRVRQENVRTQDKSRIRPGPDLDRYLDRPPQSGSIRMTHGRFGQASVFVQVPRGEKKIKIF